MRYVADHSTLSVGDKIFGYTREYAPSAEANNSYIAFGVVASVSCIPILDWTWFTESLGFVGSVSSFVVYPFQGDGMPFEGGFDSNSDIYLLTDDEYLFHILGETI